VNYSKEPYWLTDKRLHLDDFLSSTQQISSNYDVVIVGGGYTGLSASIALAKMGRTVIIFEALRLGDGGKLQKLIEYVLANYRPLPEIKSIRASKFAINVSPTNKQLCKSLENMGMDLLQLTYSLE